MQRPSLWHVRFYGRVLGLVAFPLLSAVANAQAQFPVEQPLGDLHHTSWTQKDGLPGSAMASVQTTDDDLWIGTASGLYRLEGPRFDPTATELTNGLIETSEGDLWLNSSTGITHVAATEVQSALANPGEPTIITRWDSLGGLRGRAQLGSGRDLASGDGTHWEDATTSSTSSTSTTSTTVIDVPPTLTQTWWFRLGCVLMVVAALVTCVRLRLRSLALRERDRLVVRVRERERVAQDLHDTLLQGTMSLILQLQVETRQMPEAQRVRLQRIVEDAEAVWREGRDRVKELRGEELDHAAPELVLGQIGARLVSGQEIAFALRVEGEPRRLRDLCQDDLTLIVREAIFNAVQHAKASRIAVLVHYGEDALRFEVSDDGVGMPDEFLATGGRPGHWGLSGMRERAQRVKASLVIRPGTERGTSVALSIPARWAYKEPTSGSALRKAFFRLRRTLFGNDRWRRSYVNHFE